jgi:hypothetical protein
MKKAMLFIVGMMLSVAVNAASFDFANYADTEGERGYAAYVKTEGLITVTATGTANIGGQTTPAFAYLDAGNAGLGVCKVLDGGNQCNPSSDDNALQDEAVQLTFDQRVFVSDVAFVNGGHKTNFTGTFELLVDGISQGTINLAALVTLDLWGTVFEFANNSVGDFTLAGNQFYINVLDAQVPVPAALFLFAPALLGFMGLRRKAKLAA